MNSGSNKICWVIKYSFNYNRWFWNIFKILPAFKRLNLMTMKIFIDEFIINSCVFTTTNMTLLQYEILSVFIWRIILETHLFPRIRCHRTSTLCHRFYGTCISMISTNSISHNRNCIILPAIKPASWLVVRPICLHRR